MNGLFAVFGFLSLFCVIGGAALGGVVRTWRKGGPSVNSLFFVIWGGLFAGIPLTMGLALFATHGMVYLFGIQLGLFIGVILLVALVPDSFLDAFDVAKIAPVAFGGLFLLIGIVAGVAMITTEPCLAIVVFAAFGGIGGLAFVQGIREALKT